jgi:hypothetical protein
MVHKLLQCLDEQLRALALSSWSLSVDSTDGNFQGGPFARLHVPEYLSSRHTGAHLNHSTTITIYYKLDNCVVIV